MKKFLKMVVLIFIAVFAFQLTAMAEKADTNIHIDTQTILEKDYENKGITGLYDIEMFQENESPFAIVNNNKEEYYKNLNSVLFAKDSFSSKETDINSLAQELGMFSKVNYHIGGQKKDVQEDIGFYVFESFVFIGFVTVGAFASLIYIHIRKNKEGKYVHHDYNENTQLQD